MLVHQRVTQKKIQTMSESRCNFTLFLPTEITIFREKRLCDLVMTGG